MIYIIVATACVALGLGIAIGKALRDTAMERTLTLTQERVLRLEGNVADQATVISLMTVENAQLADEASRSLPAAPFRTV